jgi:peptide subunit release factor 1 (eRF1)
MALLPLPVPKVYEDLKNLFLDNLPDEDNEECEKKLNKLMKAMLPAFVLRAVDLEEFREVVEHASKILKASEHMQTDKEVINTNCTEIHSEIFFTFFGNIL